MLGRRRLFSRCSLLRWIFQQSLPHPPTITTQTITTITNQYHQPLSPTSITNQYHHQTTIITSNNTSTIIHTFITTILPTLSPHSPYYHRPHQDIPSFFSNFSNNSHNSSGLSLYFWIAWMKTFRQPTLSSTSLNVKTQDFSNQCFVHVKKTFSKVLPGAKWLKKERELLGFTRIFCS